MSQTPDWITALKIERDAILSSQALSATEALRAAGVIRNGSQTFWLELLQQLEDVKIGLGTMGLNAIVNTSHGLSNEQQCRFNVARVGNTPRFTYTDIFWLAGSETIRCHTLEGTTMRFTFCVKDSQTLVTSDGFDMLAPQEVARKVAEPMVLRVL